MSYFPNTGVSFISYIVVLLLYGRTQILTSYMLVAVVSPDVCVKRCDLFWTQFPPPLVHKPGESSSQILAAFLQISTV